MPEFSQKVCALLLLAVLPGATVQAQNVSQAESGTIESQHGCAVAFERYTATTAEGPEVILAHGFMRKLKHMRGWGEYWQQQGVGVTLVTFCNASWFNGHHQRNADDLIAVRKHLQLDQVIYAGFSAGGLAAYLAAAEDPATRAYLGLDSVDSGDLAIERAQPLPIPALFLTAQSSMCNAQSNFQAVFDKWPQYRVQAIEQASHCHFEIPYDGKCAWLCGGADEAATTQIQIDIRDKATRWLLSQ